MSDTNDGIRIDTRGIPSRSCLNCGHDTFKILVRFDEDNTIGWYTTSGYCAACDAPVTVPTEIDDESY
jgi:hypothetical protein